MSISKKMAEWTVNCSKDYYLDRLLEVLLKGQPVEDLRDHLLAIYFHCVNTLLSDGAGAGTFADSIATLQNIIEAVLQMEDHGDGMIRLKLAE